VPGVQQPCHFTFAVFQNAAPKGQKAAISRNCPTGVWLDF
jgi:hypothetical protein